MGRFVQFNPSDPVRPFNLSGRPFPLVLSSYTGTGTEKAEERNRDLKKDTGGGKSRQKKKKGEKKRNRMKGQDILLPC